MSYRAGEITEQCQDPCCAADAGSLAPAALLPLQETELHLWVAPVPDEDDEALAVVQCALLDVEERLRMRRLRTVALQRRYRTTRALVRTVLSRYAPVPPSQWVFAASSHGRPYVDRPASATPTPRFNVSHTDRLVVLLVGCGRELGVDVEKVTRHAPMVVADQFFAAPERMALARLSDADRASRFWDHWTLKESYIKARGLGLSIPLDGFSFGFDTDDRITLAIDPTLEDRADRWRFWQFDLQNHHRLAVCAEAVPAGNGDIRAWLAVPAGGTWPLQLQCLRRSA